MIKNKAMKNYTTANSTTMDAGQTENLYPGKIILVATDFSPGKLAPRDSTTTVASAFPLRSTAGLTRKGSPKFSAVMLGAVSAILVLAAVLFVHNCIADVAAPKDGASRKLSCFVF